MFITVFVIDRDDSYYWAFSPSDHLYQVNYKVATAYLLQSATAYLLQSTIDVTVYKVQWLLQSQNMCHRTCTRTH